MVRTCLGQGEYIKKGVECQDGKNPRHEERSLAMVEGNSY